MIALLATLVLAPAHVVELVEPLASRVSIQALVNLPKLGAKDLAKLEILVQAIPKQTQEFGRREMLMISDGEPVRCSVTPDLVRIVVNVPAGRLKNGLSVMEALVHDATLTQENLDIAVQEAPKLDYWSAALNPIAYPSIKLKADEAQVLYHRVFRPDRLTLAVGGNFTPGEAQIAWASRMERWNPGLEPKGYFDISSVEEIAKNPGAVTTIDLVGAPIQSGDAALSGRILALFALGTGKGSSLFRIVREKHAWSYRQESILSPTMDGWVPRLLIAGIPTDDTAQRVATIKGDLIEDVKTWTEATRARALGMAEAVLSHQVGFSPLYVLGDSPAGNGLNDRTFLAAYWPMKTSQPWDPAALLESMSRTTLDELKEQATTILSTVIPRILPGS